MTARLIPPTTPLTQPFWDAASNQELKLQRCGTCGDRPFPPQSHCAACGSDTLSWEAVSGRGTVYTYTVAHRAPHPVFSDQCPLVIAVVELDEGPRMMSNIIGCDPQSVSIGMRVTVTFQPIDDSDITLPLFQPAE